MKSFSPDTVFLLLLSIMGKDWRNYGSLEADKNAWIHTCTLGHSSWTFGCFWSEGLPQWTLCFHIITLGHTLTHKREIQKVISSQKGDHLLNNNKKPWWHSNWRTMSIGNVLFLNIWFNTISSQASHKATILLQSSVFFSVTTFK